MDAQAPHRRRAVEEAARLVALGRDRLRGVGLRRSRRAVRHHDQRVAHLPRRRADQREQPVLGVHVPRRHRVQPGVDQPGEVPPRGRELRHRGLPPRLPAVDDGARDQRPDGLVSERRHRPEELGLPDARARLREHGHGAHAQGHPLRLARGRGHLRRHHRHHERRGLRHVGGAGARSRRLPGLCRRTASRCCA